MTIFSTNKKNNNNSIKLFFLRPEIKKIKNVFKIKNKKLNHFILAGTINFTKLVLLPTPIYFKIKDLFTKKNQNLKEIENLMKAEAGGIFDYFKNDFIVDLNQYCQGEFSHRPQYKNTTKIIKLIQEVPENFYPVIILRAIFYQHYPTLFYLQQNLPNFFKLASHQQFLDAYFKNNLNDIFNRLPVNDFRFFNKKFKFLDILFDTLFDTNNQELINKFILKSVEEKDYVTFSFYFNYIYDQHHPAQLIEKINQLSALLPDDFNSRIIKNFNKLLTAEYDQEKIANAITAPTTSNNLKI